MAFDREGKAMWEQAKDAFRKNKNVLKELDDERDAALTREIQLEEAHREWNKTVGGLVTQQMNLWFGDERSDFRTKLRERMLISLSHRRDERLRESQEYLEAADRLDEEVWDTVKNEIMRFMREEGVQFFVEEVQKELETELPQIVRSIVDLYKDRIHWWVPMEPRSPDVDHKGAHGDLASEGLRTLQHWSEKSEGPYQRVFLRQLFAEKANPEGTLMVRYREAMIDTLKDVLNKHLDYHLGIHEKKGV